MRHRHRAQNVDLVPMAEIRMIASCALLSAAVLHQEQAPALRYDPSSTPQCNREADIFLQDWTESEAVSVYFSLGTYCN